MANMLYNGVELPDIESVWTDKVTYPYACIASTNGEYALLTTNNTIYGNESATQPFYGDSAALYALSDNMWQLIGSGTENEDTSFAIYAPAIWCNADVLNIDGSVYLAASTPVPVSTFTPAEFLSWFSLGQAVRRGAVKEATMYSYNGVRLPGLPDLDSGSFPDIGDSYPEVSSANYPYMLIDDCTDDNDYIYLMCFHYRQEYLTEKGYVGSSQSPNYQLWFRLIDGAWVYYGEVGFQKAVSGTLVWSNTDILSEDGTVFFAASEPVPVYE